MGDDLEDETLRRIPPPTATIRRSYPRGLPVVVERQSRPMLAVQPPEDDDPDSQDEPPVTDEHALLDARIGMHVRRQLRGPRKLAAAALIAAFGSLGAGVVKIIDAREQAGADKVRVQVLERDLERQRIELEQLRGDLLRLRPLRDFAFPPTSSASKGPQ